MFVKYERFKIPLILLFLTIVLNRIGNYLITNNGSEISEIEAITSFILQLCSIVFFFITLIAFAYSLGKVPEKTGLVHNEKKKENQWWAIEKLEIKNIRENDGEKARIVGFSSIALSGFAIILMILLGIISIFSSLGPGLGFSGGTCDSFCERTWIVAALSGRISIYLFLIGLISLARPWSWIPETWVPKIFPDEEE